jgi:hypothetical protein
MFIENATTGSQSITISQGSGSNVTVPNGNSKLVYLDGAGATAAVVDITTTLSQAATPGSFTDLTATGTVNFTGATVDITGGTLDGVTIGGVSAGVGTFSSLTATTADINGGTLDGVTIGAVSAGAGTFTTLSDQDGDVRAVPPVGTKTSSYTLTTSDIGQYVQVGTGGSITIPDATFSEGDVVSIFNNTANSVTITCSITTAYVAGEDVDVATASLVSRGVATILFISGTVCVLTGNFA